MIFADIQFRSKELEPECTIESSGSSINPNCFGLKHLLKLVHLVVCVGHELAEVGLNCFNFLALVTHSFLRECEKLKTEDSGHAFAWAMLEINTWWDRRVIYVSPLVELHPQSASCLFQNFPNASHLSHEPTQLSVSLERLELLVGVRQSLQSFGLVDFVFEPCNLRLNSVIGVVPWSQKSHKTQVMVGPHASDFNISSIFHDPKIFLKKDIYQI